MYTGCLGGTGGLLQAHGKGQAWSDWLQTMASHIRLHYTAGEPQIAEVDACRGANNITRV